MLGGDRDRLLERLRAELQTWAQAPADEVLHAWRRLSDTLGRRVRVELPSGPVEGIAEDVDTDGALIVAGRRVAAGDVIYLIAREGAEAPPQTAPG